MSTNTYSQMSGLSQQNPLIIDFIAKAGTDNISVVESALGNFKGADALFAARLGASSAISANNWSVLAYLADFLHDVSDKPDVRGGDSDPIIVVPTFEVAQDIRTYCISKTGINDEPVGAMKEIHVKCVAAMEKTPPDHSNKDMNMLFACLVDNTGAYNIFTTPEEEQEKLNDVITGKRLKDEFRKASESVKKKADTKDADRAAKAAAKKEKTGAAHGDDGDDGDDDGDDDGVDNGDDNGKKWIVEEIHGKGVDAVTEGRLEESSKIFNSVVDNTALYDGFTLSEATKAKGPKLTDFVKTRVPARMMVATFAVVDEDATPNGSAAEPSPYVSIADPEEEIALMLDADDAVVKANTIRVLYTHPLNTTGPTLEEKEAGGWIFKEDAPNGKSFSRADIARAVSARYHMIYDEEAKTTMIKPDYIPGTFNRNHTNGIYGIWKYDISDLHLHSVELDPLLDIYILGIES